MSNGANQLQYHLPDAPRYSIAYIDDNISRGKSKLEEYKNDPTLDIISGSVSVDGNDVFHIYTRNDITQFEGDVDRDLQEWAESLSQDDSQFLLLVYDIFDGIIDTVGANDNIMDIYKRMDHKKIPEITNRVEWKQSVATVGSELLSRFILTHPMPNSNHRTALGVVDRYFASYDSDFSLPDTGEDQSWYPWASDYIYDSKRLLSLRRKSPLLKRAKECGYDRVRRKDGAEFDLDEHNLQRDDYVAYYADRHQQRTREFIEVVLKRTQMEHLKHQQDKGKSVFIDRLQAAD